MTHRERIPYPPALDHRRVESTHTAEIRTAPGKIFPLACPVEELRWIPDWEYELVYSRSGVNENHCIFRERLSGPLFFGAPIPTTWYTTLYDPERYRVQFLLMIGGAATIKWELTCRETGRDTTTVTLHLVFTALDEKADALTEAEIREKLEAIAAFLFPPLQHYCETGRMLA